MIKDAAGRTIIYDAFIRDGWLTLVSTYYHYREGPVLRIRVGGRLMQEIGVNEYEPVRAFRLEWPDSDRPPSDIEINEVLYPLTVDVVTQEPRTPGFAVATLFNHDWAHTGSMIEWYRAQGVTAFYLYFNGPALPSGPGLPTGPDIHYRLWNFQYWNRADYKDKETGWVHAAQTAFLTMVRYRHLPDHAWIALVDIDEHVWSADGRRLIDVLADVAPEVGVIRVPCHWALRAHNRIIYTQTGERVGVRSKCLYRGDYDGFIGVHNPKPVGEPFDHPSLRMLHVTNYTHSDRIGLIKEPRGEVPWPTQKLDR
jgi:hypothetical protein